MSKIQFWHTRGQQTVICVLDWITAVDLSVCGGEQDPICFFILPLLLPFIIFLSCTQFSILLWHILKGPFSSQMINSYYKWIASVYKTKTLGKHIRHKITEVGRDFCFCRFTFQSQMMTVTPWQCWGSTHRPETPLHLSWLKANWLDFTGPEDGVNFV